MLPLNGLARALSLVGRVHRIAVASRIQATCFLSRRLLVVVHIQETGLREHVEPVVEWLISNARVGIVVVVPTSKAGAYRAVTKLPFDTGYLWLTTERMFASSAWRPRVLLSIHPETPSSIGGQLAGTPCWRLVMQHGLSDKAVFANTEAPDPLVNADVVLLAGPVFRDGSLRTYANRHPTRFRQLRILETGLPKTDGLFNPMEDRTRVLSDMGLDPARPTVCYAPTFEKTASLQRHGSEIIRALCGLKTNVIVKLHHWSLKDPRDDPWAATETEGVDWRSMMATLERQYSNLRLAAAGDARPYLVASDVLVSDASGVAYEFLLLDRPIVFFDIPDLFADVGTDGLHYWGRECGTIVTDTADLVEAVAQALREPNMNQPARRRLAARLLYEPGRSTAATGEAIVALTQGPGRRIDAAGSA